MHPFSFFPHWRPESIAGKNAYMEMMYTILEEGVSCAAEGEPTLLPMLFALIDHIQTAPERDVMIERLCTYAFNTESDTDLPPATLQKQCTVALACLRHMEACGWVFEKEQESSYDRTRRLLLRSPSGTPPFDASQDRLPAYIGVLHRMQFPWAETSLFASSPFAALRHSSIRHATRMLHAFHLNDLPLIHPALSRETLLNCTQGFLYAQCYRQPLPTLSDVDAFGKQFAAYIATCLEPDLLAYALSKAQVWLTQVPVSEEIAQVRDCILGHLVRHHEKRLLETLSKSPSLGETPLASEDMLSRRLRL